MDAAIKDWPRLQVLRIAEFEFERFPVLESFQVTTPWGRSFQVDRVLTSVDLWEGCEAAKVSGWSVSVCGDIVVAERFLF